MYVHNFISNFRGGGVVIEKVKYQNLSPLNEQAVSLKTLKFVPHFPNNNSDVSIFLRKYKIENFTLFFYINLVW